MKRVKIGLYVLLAALVIIQFIRPEKNIGAGSSDKEITRQYAVPAEIETILRTSCYDCHSNSTAYPWYAEIQPAGWIVAGDIHDAKRALNFDEFASYRLERQLLKFENIADEVETEGMPLPSYVLLHRDAVLSDSQKTLLINWVQSMQDSLRSLHPHETAE